MGCVNAKRPRVEEFDAMLCNASSIRLTLHKSQCGVLCAEIDNTLVEFVGVRSSLNEMASYVRELRSKTRRAAIEHNLQLFSKGPASLYWEVVRPSSRP